MCSVFEVGMCNIFDVAAAYHVGVAWCFKAAGTVQLFVSIAAVSAVFVQVLVGSGLPAAKEEPKHVAAYAVREQHTAAIYEHSQTLW